MTKRLHFYFSFSCIGEGNGNPLQCSCLENPRDREAWWAAVYGVTQSRTRLKRLSSSSSHENLGMFFLPLWVWKMWTILYVNCEDYRSKVCIEYLHYNEPLWMVAILITMKKILIIIKFLFCCWISHKFRDMVDWSLEINIHKHNDMHLIDVLVS